ncbi:MAG: DNA-3-methyladenine glycosylase I [Candidatus Bathyarchaeia archaeon]
MSDENGIVKRCWNTLNPLFIKYHDEEWGVPIHDDKRLFEFLALGGFQAGLTWELILNRRKAFRNAFDHFDPAIVTDYDENDVECLLNDRDIIRNKAKIKAVINNATMFIEVQKEFGSFDVFVWKFVGGRSINNAFKKYSDIPPESSEAIDLSKELKKRGFQFVGPKICYAFMQATGLINDHIINCFRHNQIRQMQHLL